MKRVTLEEPEDILFTEITSPRASRPSASDEATRGEADMSPEALLAAGYAGFLLLAAFVLEWLSAHTHRRALRYRTAGFTYHEQHDHWLLPRGPAPVAARVRPRAPPRPLPRQGAHLQRLPAQGACTDSDRGREIVRPLDPWPHSEAGRFHRGLSLMLVALSLLVILVGAARNHAAPTSRCWWRCSRSRSRRPLAVDDFRAHPAGFPEPIPPTGCA